MIVKPSEMKQSTKKVAMLIAGFPGIGKTTLALSAPKPLLIDVDRGIDRVQVQNRKDYTYVQTYDELLKDLNGDLSEYETIVIDTGGKLLELMKPYVIKKDSKNGQKDGETLSIKGYAAVGKEFQKFVDNILYKLNKNCVVVFHAKEEKEGEDIKLRILVEGSTKDNIWQPMDLGGFIEIINGKRYISFDNCERYYAKGTHGIKGKIEIPDNSDGKVANDLLTQIFEAVNKNIIDEQQYFNKQKEDYEKIMSDIIPQIENMTAENVDEVTETMKNAKHILTSEKELKHKFKAKIDELGMYWNPNDNKWELKEVKNEEISNNSKPTE